MDIEHSNNLNILCIDENANEEQYYNELLDKYASNIIFSKEETQAFNLYKEYSPDIIITNICNSTFDFAQKVKEIDPFQPILIRTEISNSDYMLQSFDLDLDAYLLKSDNDEKFISKINYIIKKYSLRNRNIKKRKTLENILHTQSGIAILTDFENISFASKSFLDFFHLNVPNEIFNRYENILDIFIPHEEYIHGRTKDEFLKRFESAKAIDKIVLILGQDFNPKAFHIHLDKISETEDLYVISLSNISFMQEKNIEISHKAYVDGLTNVYNRNKFEERFSYEFSKYQRYKDTFSIAVLDIDHFKKFNDTYGHLIGDEVLILLAEKINNNIRNTDTFARWGGEEFVILMPNTDAQEATVFCEKLRILVEEICHITAGNITCSFGITQIKKTDSLKSIFKRCDEALYHAKANGRNRIEVKE